MTFIGSNVRAPKYRWKSDIQGNLFDATYVPATHDIRMGFTDPSVLLTGEQNVTEWDVVTGDRVLRAVYPGVVPQGSATISAFSASHITISVMLSDFGGGSGGCVDTSRIGQSIVIIGSTTPANNGTFPIFSVPSSTSLQYTNAAGVNDGSPIDWRIINGPDEQIQNGIYVVNVGAWTRATDADSWSEIENAVAEQPMYEWSTREIKLAGTSAVITGTAPTMTITGLSGMTAEMATAGMLLAFFEASNPGNNGLFPIVTWNSLSSVDITNASGVAEATPQRWALFQSGGQASAAAPVANSQLISGLGNMSASNIGDALNINGTNSGQWIITGIPNSTEAIISRPGGGGSAAAGPIIWDVFQKQPTSIRWGFFNPKGIDGIVDTDPQYWILSSGSLPDQMVLVSLVSDTPVILNGPQVIDGNPTGSGVDVLINGQSSAIENGIYTVNHAGAWSRSTNWPVQLTILWQVVIALSSPFGLKYPNKHFVLSSPTTTPIVPGVTPQEWRLYNGENVASWAPINLRVKFGDLVSIRSLVDNTVLNFGSQVVITLPPITQNSAGRRISVRDVEYFKTLSDASITPGLMIQPAGSDSVETGGPGELMTAVNAIGQFDMESDGLSRWTIVGGVQLTVSGVLPEDPGEIPPPVPPVPS